MVASDIAFLVNAANSFISGTLRDMETELLVAPRVNRAIADLKTEIHRLEKEIADTNRDRRTATLAIEKACEAGFDKAIDRLNAQVAKHNTARSKVAKQVLECRKFDRDPGGVASAVAEAWHVGGPCSGASHEPHFRSEGPSEASHVVPA